MNFNFLGAETPTDFRGWIQEGFLQPSDGKQGRRRRRRRRRSKLEIFATVDTCSQCFESFTGMYLQVCNYRSIFKITSCHKYCIIQYANASFQF